MNIKLQIGQRWNYKNSYYDYIMEIISMNDSIFVEIIQCNKDSIECKYKVGYKYYSSALNSYYQYNIINDEVFYMKGQDKVDVI